MKHFIKSLGITLALIVFLAGSSAAKNHEVNASEGLTLKGAPLALRGYDPVSYFEGDGPVLGSAEHSAVHEGVTYRFVSKKSMTKFERDPDRYLPRYGGFCAYGVSVGAKFDGDPLVWRIVDGKLYLNLNPDIQKTWNDDVDGAIRKADRNWPRIRTTPPSKLKP